MDAGMLAYKESFERFFRLGEDAGADGYIANHPYRDLTSSTAKATESPRTRPASRPIPVRSSTVALTSATT
jgi:hypothetical protein